jgi:hypothetical protein
MTSGTYLPPPGREVVIPKRDGGERKLGIPTVADRIAQTVVKNALEPENITLSWWAMRKYKRFRGHRRRAEHWLGRIARRQPMLFAHWQLVSEADGWLIGVV